MSTTKFLDYEGLVHYTNKAKATFMRKRIAGLIFSYAGIAPPAGFLLCDGTEYNITDYQELYDAIGTTYGGAEGTFKVPDLRGRVPIGYNATYALGSKGGEAQHKLTIPELPAHNHAASTASAGAHSHKVAYSATGVRSGAYWQPLTIEASGQEGTTIDYMHTAGAHTHDVTVSTVGTDRAHNNMQPYLAANFIISTGKTDMVVDDVSFEEAVQRVEEISVWYETIANRISVLEANTQKVLWSGSKQMTGSETITLNGKVSEQRSGIMLAFSAQTDGSLMNYNWHYAFVPKTHVTRHSGGAVNVPMGRADFSIMGNKYLSIYDDSITGNDTNNSAGVKDGGLAFNNAYWVLREVIGV